MKKVRSGAGYFYRRSGTIRGINRMKDIVDRAALQKATDITIKRYPYFSVRVVKKDGSYWLAENDNPISVRESNVQISLGGRASNYHLIDVSCWENIIYVDYFHGISDGIGMLQFTKTLLYYYCCYRYNITLDGTGVRLVDTPITDEELDEPFPEEPITGIEAFDLKLPKEAFKLPDKIDPDNPTRYLYEVQLPMKSFMKYTKAHDGSPAVICSLFLARAIDAIFPDSELPLVCEMALNVRPILNKPLAHHNTLEMLYLTYQKEMRKLSIETQAGCFRGMVFLQSSEEHIISSINNDIMFNKMLDAQDSIEKKQALMLSLTDGNKKKSFMVSYEGQANFGSIEEYMIDKSLLAERTLPELLVEITSVSDAIQVDFLQAVKNEEYFRMFVKLLEDEGIPCQVSKPLEYTIPGVGFE